MSDVHGGYPGAPPGWYPDPAGGLGQRWWDGYNWSDAVVAPAPPSGTPAWAVASGRLASAATTHQLQAERAMVNVARVAVALPAVHYVVDFIIQQADASEFHAIGDHFRVQWHDIQNNIPTQAYNETTHLSWLSGFFVLVTLAAVVVACVWQHRAASAARALGLPSTHSPAWGVGSWFVPVVNLFIPYQAIRDCLAAGDPGRVLVLRWWLILMGAWTTALAAQIAIFFSRAVAVGFGVVSLLFALGLLSTAPRMVSTIATSHRALLEQADRTASLTR